MKLSELAKQAVDASDSALADSIYEYAVLQNEDDPVTSKIFDSVGDVYWKRFHASRNLSDLDKTISCYEDAVRLTQDFHERQANRLYFLGLALGIRFENAGEVADINKACSVFEGALLTRLHANSPTRYTLMGELGRTLMLRFKRLEDVDDIERAATLLLQLVDIAPEDDGDRHCYMTNLGGALKERFNRFGNVSDLEASILVKRKAVNLIPDDHPDKSKCLDNLGMALMEQFERLGHICDLEAAVTSRRKAVELTPDGHPDKAGHLSHLGTVLASDFQSFGDMPVLEESIAIHRMAVKLAFNGHPDKPSYLMHLGNALDLRFERLSDVSDIEESVAVKKMAVELTPESHADKPIYLLNLGSTIYTRLQHTGSSSDLEESLHVVSAAARLEVGAPRNKFRAAYGWCILSETTNDPQQTLEAYRCAIGLIPQVAWMGTEIECRHQQLERVGNMVRRAAAAAVKFEEYDLALEWLEQGRSVVWGQTLQLRSPLDLLRERDPNKAGQLSTISRALDANAKDQNSSTEAKGQQLRSLSRSWDNLVSEVRRLEGFGDFLGPKKIAQLIPAARFGPVVVLNSHPAGCDALVLMAGAEGIIHIPLQFTPDSAQALLDTLQRIESGQSPANHVGPVDRGFRFPAHGSDMDEEIKNILAELWNNVVRPVLDGLAFQIPETRGAALPRIWWCPTGPLALLPIHAAGLYNTEEPGTKITEFVVSSYTPTVSALIQPRSSSEGGPKILAVAQSETPGQSALPNTRTEVEHLRRRAAASGIELTVAQDRDGTVECVLEEMTRCNWIHLACHGTQDLEHPTKSAFILADGNLELAEIIRHPLPHAEFAFLSACQTATGDSKLTDEAVHLAAGMLLAGYRSVIATMWAILDKDGPIVADMVYAELLKDGQADHTRAAYALHHAAQSLRLSGAPFMAWMPFIHIGV